MILEIRGDIRIECTPEDYADLCENLDVPSSCSPEQIGEAMQICLGEMIASEMAGKSHEQAGRSVTGKILHVLISK